MRSHAVGGCLIFFGLFYTAYAQNPQNNSCSIGILSCDPRANCTEIGDNSFTCICPFGLSGDGFRNGTGCGLPPCDFTSQCHPHADCIDSVCKCKTGFTQNLTDCFDIDECSENPCSPHASCENTEGSFSCACNQTEGYLGNGFTCQHVCSVSADCTGSNEICVGFECVCAIGYHRSSNDTCVNINECELNGTCNGNATCTDTVGSFTCQCINGFRGDGFTCTAIPKNCHEIKMADPSAESAEYLIDPDGTGPLDEIMVECEMRPDLGITIISPIEDEYKVKTSRTTFNVNYEPSLDHIVSVIQASTYCYQSMSYQCQWGAKLLNLKNDLYYNDYWLDRHSNPQYTWGGAKTTGDCACGGLGYCENPDSKCNCDGSTNSKRVDNGKETDKAKLPILRVVSQPDKGNGQIKIGAVNCAPKSFDVPRDCHEAKFNPYYLITRNGPQLLDFDGPEGPLEPVQAHCDMETYDHVGITVIPHEDRIPKEPEGGTNPINYKVIENATEALVNISEFCYQEVRYNCNNSRLQNNGDMKGFFSGPDGVPRDYFPGGMNQQYKCACGLTGTCASDNYGCNCDVNDGVLRSDFGPVVNSSDLPITSLTFLEVGPGHWGEYFVGPLMCSQRQFGIPATCSGYVHQEYTEDHTYLIDPDGAPDPEKPSEENVDFFPAFCEFHDDYAVTVIPTETDQENQTISITGSLLYSYRLVTNAQLKVLIERAVFCTQAITYKCTRAPIHVGYSNHVTWTTKDGNEESYFAGDGWEDVCECGLLQNCFNGFHCNCDANDDQEREDSGLLLDKWDLPIMQVNFMQLSGSASVSVGPMRCSDLFPNCYFMKKFMKNDKVPGTPSWANGMKTIDPDGAGGVEAFKVICEGSITRVPAEPDPTEDTNSEPLSPVTKCYDITYQVNGQNISSDQLQALVDASKHCKQELTMKCFNAQITNHVNYSKCNGDTIPGWAGSKGAPMCACGITGTCVQGEPNCNCDLEDGKLRNDTGWITDIELLPVCHICVTLDPAEHVNSTPQYRNATTIVSALVCNNKALTGGVGKCQDLREQGVTASGTYQLDPDGYKGTPYFSVYCRFEAFPPVGFVEIFPKEPVVEIPPNGTDVMIYYYVQEMVLLKKLISLSGSCTQTIHIECVNASLTFSITNEEGWYDVEGNYHSNWIGNKEDNEGCTGGQCNCNLGGIQFDGGVITDKDLLPVTRIKIGHISEASGLRKAFIGKIICHDLFPTCDAIKKARKNKNPFGHNIYTIDADQEGPVPHFAVKCDFRTDESLGITIINTDNKITFVKNVVTPGGIPKNITYQTVWPGDRENITYEQAHALATVSGFCYQGIKYICYNSPLINSSDTTPGYYSTYDDVQSLSFGVAGHSDTVGCPCVLLDTCPANHICHCDEMEAFARDYGHETNRSNLPIITVNFGGQTAPIAVATYQISDMRCGPKPFDLPKHCDDAYQNYGFDRSGEVLIWPHVDGSDDYIEPYLVYCDMNHLVRGGGVTIIKHNLPANSNVTYNETVVLTYKDATHEQVKKMVDLSLFCKQPFKYECINTKFENFFSWRGGTSDDDLEYVGFGRYNLDKTECNCGEQGLCGGSENRDILVALKRGCNCDSADNLTRADAGIFRDKHLLQIREITFTDPDVPGASGTLTLGPLYCSETDFEINECTSGFHDCHEKAVCKNIVGGSYECRCLPGYRAIGVPDFWANGRNCYDNDECAAGHYCPSMSSNCTNTDGSFYCTCLDGYHQTGPQTCIDIDECTEETNSTPCDENAKCINVDGSYHCMCNRGYRGNGFECAPVSICACFGDPHCYSLDDRLLTFMGACQYVMATDDCETNPNEPLFEVLSTFTRRDFPAHVPVSWVKDVTVKVYNYTIHLRRDEKVLIDNVLTNLPWRKENVSVVLSGRYIKVFTEFGVQVNWDMVQLVEVYVPGQWKEKVCGLCGNYNDNATDDWILGPQCPQPNTTFVNNANLFGDSWSVPEYIADNPVCTPNCTEFNDTDPCTGDRLQMAEIVCEPIFGQNQKFKKCLEELNEADETFVLALKEFCIKDACAVEDDLSVVVCRVAEQMYEFCKTRYNIIVDYRDEHFCPKDCEDNKVHSDCGPEAPLTCLDILTNSTPSTDGCAEGCFCPEGMVLDTDKCVNESGCGCLFEGRYYPVGAKVVRNECDEKGICLGNNQFNFTDIDCHDNATCDNRDGIIDCHCNEGFYGNGVDECKPDPCSPNPCNVSEDCLRDNTTDRGYVCLCADGYSGDCDNCKDVDECLTGTHDCKPNQHCKNTDGSFVCECEEGYIYLQGICQDINECRPPGNRSDPCGDNSKCMNLIGTYECPCCQGFEKNETGDCVETDAEPTEEQPYCCTCEIAICDREGQVCSEDGKTYDNMRDMIISRCEEGLDSHKWIAVDYFSKCKGSCSKVQCPKYQYCNDSGGKPKCECDKCTPEEIIIYQDKVCTEHRIIYENFCVFKEMMCKYDYEYEIELLTSIVPCEKGSGNSPVGPWGEPGPCSVNCGLGVQTRTRQANRNLTTEEQQAFPLTHEQYCFLEQCEDGPCFNFTCPTVAHVCDVVDNTTAECICPPVDPLNTTEVCGYIMTDTGPEPAREWHNAGYLRRHACKNNAEDYVVMNEGECGDEPPHCTPIPHRSIYSFDHSQYGNCNTTQEINWYECAGGCDNVKEWCCHSKKEAEVTQPESVNCDEADEELSISVTLVQDCECQDIEIVHGSP